MKYLIIGNSAAAVGCIEGIRSIDPEGPITLLSREPFHTYSRPLISYLLCGKTDEERMKYRADDFYGKNRVTALLGREATSIDPKAKTVRTAGGTLSYDRLLVATGSRPFVPPAEGMELIEKKFTFLSLDDAHALGAALFPGARVLIVGAGLIGLKCAEGIAGRCKSITVVDLADRILPSILDAESSAVVRTHIEAHGVSFLLGDSVERFTAGEAVLKSGGTVPYDLVVFAVGVRPNTELVKEAGGRTARGICTDDHCRTSLPGVWAAGDCAESYDITTGQERVLALLPNAYMQGECAGINMAGGDRAYDRAMPMNAIGFFGLHVITAGSYEGESFVSRGGNTYKRLVTQGNRLAGYILVGGIERAGIYTTLIRERTPLDTIDFVLIREKPQLMAFSRAERAHRLGGVTK